MNTKLIKSKKGFTLIEILVVVGIIAVLAAIVLVAINPARQFKQAHDTQRLSNVNAILNAIGQNITDNQGSFKCNGVVTSIPTTAGYMKSTASAPDIDIYPCLVPTYMANLPFDPTDASAKGSTTASVGYNTRYQVIQDANGRITISAVGEITSSISVTR